FYNESKGFGFIKSENGEEIFVHITGLIDKINQDDQVEFEVTQGKKGLNAVNVKLV
ncbi:MAG: cold shock domain-containing protein, partial [Flavobacterium sp.]